MEQNNLHTDNKRMPENTACGTDENCNIFFQT